MMPVLFLCILFFTSVAPIFFPRKDSFLIAFIQLLMVGLIVATVGYAFYQPQAIHSTLTVLDFDGIRLSLSLQFDLLAKIVSAFILVIGFIIYRYAQNYLESDSTRMRFLSQFNLVLSSVLLLVLSANLLTAFVAWQFIGINLYLLLNHYHHDAAANRAAKKKFIINRVGDCSFLLAIVLTFHSGAASSFEAIQLSTYAGWICALLFISVMTKCAQFPFHSWLIDTLETPTPVSALMHAGVINAGGILLARVSGALTQFHYLVYLILLVGLVSALLSVHWMNQQPDIKKKLAYSTMGQMGYMLTQCGLGAFPAAIFHLMSHGFYKASLFLNAGQTLCGSQEKSYQTVCYKSLLKAFSIALLIFSLGLFLFREVGMSIPLLIYGFMFITIMTMVLKMVLLENTGKLLVMSCYLAIGLLFFFYLCFFYGFSRLLYHYDYTGIISTRFQLLLLLALFIFQCYSWLSKGPNIATKFKDGTERFLRRFFLNPLRVLGNIINIQPYRKAVFVFYAVAMLITTTAFVYGLMFNASLVATTVVAHKSIISIFLLIGIFALTVANRCFSIKLLMVYLVLFELAFTNIAFFDGDINVFKIGIFHIMNISTVLLMLALLARRNPAAQTALRSNNRFPRRVFYLVLGLLLLIGIPGTASFISEFYLLSALLGENLILALMYLSLIMLLSIVIMHSLQLYAFNKNYSILFSEPIAKLHHLVFLAVIIFNVMCGLFPGIILNHL